MPVIAFHGADDGFYNLSARLLAIGPPVLLPRDAEPHAEAPDRHGPR
jgi:hypothetical protein